MDKRWLQNFQYFPMYVDVCHNNYSAVIHMTIGKCLPKLVLVNLNVTEIKWPHKRNKTLFYEQMHLNILICLNTCIKWPSNKTNAIIFCKLYRTNSPIATMLHVQLPMVISIDSQRCNFVLERNKRQPVHCLWLFVSWWLMVGFFRVFD